MTLGQFLFKYRSYTPAPFLIPALLFARPTIISLTIGFILLLIGEAIRYWAVSYAGIETRTTKIGASKLVTQGPYAYNRNPLYTGSLLMYAGGGIMSNALVPYLQIAGIIFFCFQYYLIIKEEEKFLHNEFKEKYENYFNSVSRFIPGKPYDESKQSKIKVDWKAGWLSEKRTRQSFEFYLIMVVLLYFLVHHN